MKTSTLAFVVLLFSSHLWAQDEPQPSVRTEPTLQEEAEAVEEEVEEVVSTDGPVLQDTVWRTSINVGLNFNQAAFSDNWIGGGINSIAFSSFFNYQAHYKKDDWSWDNEADLLYGVISSKGQGSRKSQDRVYLDSKVGKSLSEDWNAYFSLNFLTQFGAGYRYEDNAQGVEQSLLVSKFMSPGFLTASLGFEYDPNDNFTLRLSPLSSRLTFVSDPTVFQNVLTRYGLDAGDNVRYEWYALQIQANYNKNLTETIHLKARYLLFANYENFSPSNWDHRLELLFSASLTRFINVSFATIFLYDRDQVPDPQISQSLGVGILFQKEGAY